MTPIETNNRTLMLITDKDYEDVLDLEFNAAGVNTTIRAYLCILLKVLWTEKESFSSKRPFGDSDWEYDLYSPLIRASVVEGELDEYGHVNVVDKEQADNIIAQLIRYVFLPRDRYNYYDNK